MDLFCQDLGLVSGCLITMEGLVIDAVCQHRGELRGTILDHHTTKYDVGSAKRKIVGQISYYAFDTYKI
jgi:hypothetical protein